MVRHLVGAGIGLVAVPVLMLLSTWAMREQRLFAEEFSRAHGVLMLVAVLLLGAAVGVLCAGRLVSPVASLVSGGLLFLLCGAFWFPYVLLLGVQFDLEGWLGRAVGWTPTLLVLSVVLVVASVAPSRWRAKPPRSPQPRPLPAQEVRP